MSREKGEADSAKLAWPPTKEDLQRLYVDEKLSASKIAKVYCLKYASPKTAESTILHHLKRNGITRRDPAAHIRKVTETMVDEWVASYQGGESLKQIAGDAVDSVTVFNHLRKRGLQLRDKVEAQINTVAKHEKTPFSGDRHEMAYIVGIAVGDYASTRHGRAVRVKTSTTHPAMTKLFRSLFEGHGPIYEYPRENVLTGFEWSLDCDLDASYSFLLEVKELAVQVVSDEELFFDFLAGLFDAEGTIYYHRKKKGGAFELSLANTNLGLLREIGRKLDALGISFKLRRTRIDRQKALKRRIKNSVEVVWKLDIWRYENVRQLVQALPLRHPERVAKAAIAQKLEKRPNPTDRKLIVAEWINLINDIKLDSERYIVRARDIWTGKLNRGMVNH